MNARTLVTALGVARLGFGGLYALAPEKAAPQWIGRLGRRSGPQVLSVAFGARDFGLGVGTLAGLRSGSVRPWLLVGLLADGADLVATLRARDGVPLGGVVGVGVMATTALAIQAIGLAELE